MKRFVAYLNDSWQELSTRVTWPGWEKLQSSSLLVLVATLVLAVIVFAVDWVFQLMMETIYAL